MFSKFTAEFSRVSRFLVFAFTALFFAAPSRAALDAPVATNAQPGVAELLNYLNTVSGHQIIAGQQEIAWDLNRQEEDIDFVKATTGKTPGVRGFDFLQYVYSPSVRANQNATERAIAWAKAGGIVNFCCHMFMNIGSTNGQPQFYVPGANGNPTGTSFDIRQAVIAGTPENTEYLAKLDIIATELKKLRDAGVVVVWRPFHECSGNWFWWSAYGATPLKKAWKIMFDRFNTLHGLNNLIWVFNPTDSYSNLVNWYPGDDMVDIISLDTYPPGGTHLDYSDDYKRMRDFKTGRKVVTMSENGPIPDVDKMFTNGGGWAYFCTWNGFENDPAQNSVSFLNAVYNNPSVVTFDKLPAFLVTSTLSITTPPQDRAVPPGGAASLNVAALGGPTATYQWQLNGLDLAGATGATLALSDVQPASAGLYTVVATNTSGTVTSNPAILGLSTTNKVVGAGSEVNADVTHPNGKIFDQVLLTGAAETITADYLQGQITRTSYIDLNDDIVQVEFGGPGTLSLILDSPGNPAAPVNYDQPGTMYMKGHATIVITGANENTNVSVFTVGRATAFDPTGVFDILQAPSSTNVPANNGSSLFVGHDSTHYDGIADIALIAISSTDGKFGGVRTSNADYSAVNGMTGIYAPNVQFTGPLYLGNIGASGTATPVIVVGSVSDARITGGDLAQANGEAVQISGLTQLNFTAGVDSGGNALTAKTNQAVLHERGSGTDVTSAIVVNPTP